MEKKQQSEAERAIENFRKIDEVESHKKVYQPLLESLGFTHIVYCHGPFERGKDFVCLDVDRLGTSQLVVIQVKNERISARSRDQAAAVGIVNQLSQCLQSKVLHPVTSREELPRKALLFTSYPIPDHALAGMGDSLDSLLRSCEIVGPTRLIELLKAHLPEVYAELVFPGDRLSAAMLNNVKATTELSAIGVLKERELGSFFVNIGISSTNNHLEKIASGTMKFAPKGRRFHYPRDLYRTVESLASALSSELSLAPLLHFIPNATATRVDTARKRSTLQNTILADDPALSTGNFENPIDISQNVTFEVGDFDVVLDRLESLRKDIEDRKSNKQQLFEKFVYCTYLANSLLAYMEGRSSVSAITKVRDEEKRPTYELKFTEIDPPLLISSKTSFAITGDAGSGKTSLSRTLTTIACQANRRCIYFPCSKIESHSDSLRTSISQHLVSANAISRESDLDRILEGVSVVILDGCDESATFSSKKLSRELQRLHFRSPCSLSFDAIEPCGFYIPLDLRDQIRLEHPRDSSASHAITILKPIHAKDFDRLQRLNDGGVLTAILPELRKAQEKRTTRVILTSRSLDPLTLGPDYAVFQVLPFTDSQLDRFLRKWFVDDDSTYEKVAAFVRHDSHIRNICRTPMVATLVAALEENGYDLPKSKTDIYHKRFDLLLEKWDSLRKVPSRTRITAADKYRILSRIAWKTHSRNRIRFTQSDLEEVWNNGFSSLYKRCSIRQVIAELQYSNNVIYSAGEDEFTLGHLSYQEYLAAKELVNRQNPRYLLDKFSETWWRQVFVFYAGITGNVERLFKMVQAKRPINRADPLIQEMLAEARYTPPDLASFLRE